MIRLAAAADWPTIDAWRAGHYERMRRRNGLAIYPGTGLGDAVWLVSAERDLMAAISFFDRPPTRAMHDLYWQPGFAGKRAAYVLAATVLQFAHDLELDVQGNTNIANWEYRALLRRVGFRIYQYDYPNDVCYFRRERSEGRYVRQFQGHHADQRQRSRLSQAAAANPEPAHYGAASQ